jgi:iron complex transport system substrate-binding protein
MQAGVKTLSNRDLYFLILFLCGLLILNGCSGLSQKKNGIISIGPNITEILFQIGAGGRVIGIGDFDDYPPEIRDLPKVGSYISPNIEKITTLNPQIIITAGEVPHLRNLAEEINAKYYSIPMDTLEEIYAGIIKLGEITDSQSRAMKLV